MPLGPAIGAALTTPTAKAYGLFVDGLDLLRQPGAGTVYATDLASIEVEEAGPGGVSSMTFTVDDPNKTLSIPAEAPVIFVNQTLNERLFAGIVKQVTASPWFGGQGRTLTITADGEEQWLDHFRVKPSRTELASDTTNLNTRLARLCTAITGGFLYDATFSLRDGDATTPIGALNQTTPGSPVPILSIDVTFDGVTLREALRQFVAAGKNNDQTIPVTALITVDHYRRVRIWPDRIDAVPDDWTNLTIVDTAAGANAAGDLSATVEYYGIVHEVFAIGASVSGWFSDGSGKRGKQDVINTTATTQAELLLATQNYFAGIAGTVRGSFTLGPWTPPATVHAGSTVNITDAATGLATNYRIGSITKTFLGNGKEFWRVAFGGLRPSAVRYMRQLTRSEF